MTLPVNPQTVYRVEFRQELHGNAMYNVMHYITDTEVQVEDLISMAGLMGDAWGDATGPMAAMCTEVFLREVAVQKIWPTRGPLMVAPSDYQGAIAGDPMPNQVCLVVSHITNAAGRRARGRSYIGGLPKTVFDSDTGRWLAATAEAIASALEDLEEFPALNAAHAGEFVQWSDNAMNGEEVRPAEFFAHLAHVGRVIPAVIRRRRIGTGI